MFYDLIQHILKFLQFIFTFLCVSNIFLVDLFGILTFSTTNVT